jgi:hypothetical protein
MRKAMRIICWSAAYWFASLLIFGFVVILHGDCGTAGDRVQKCIVEGQQISWALIVGATALYATLLYRMNRRSG